MAAWVEFKYHGIAYGRLDSVWIVYKFTIVTYFDGVLGGEDGPREKREKNGEAHFTLTGRPGG
jgi:hypothetical protein